MEEELILFETAKLAKEKGFDIPVLYAFDDDNGQITSSYCKDVFDRKNYNTSGYKCSRPTQSLLQKWLREIHNIDIEIFKACNKDSSWYRVYIKQNDKVVWNPAQLQNESMQYKKYEQAIEVVLFESLKLIK